MEPITLAKLSLLPALALNILAIYDLKFNNKGHKLPLTINAISAIFISLFIIIN